ncbi:MAG: DNA repair protein RadC [Pseudomonadota bacterium]
MSGNRGHDGFSEEALRLLDERIANEPPPEFYERDADRAGPQARPVPDRRPHYWGHRERLRTRFLEANGAGLPDYELMEMILFNAIPRVDVKPLAKRLIAEFGSFDKAIAASKHQLERVPGVNPKVYFQFRLMAATARRLTRSKIVDRPIIGSWTQLIEFCNVLLASREVEEFWVLFLDKKNILIQEENLAVGSVDHVPVYPRQVAKRALELNATALILIHNHPSGDPTPSADDIRMTQEIEEACRIVGAVVHDHVIIGKGRHTSLRQQQLI